MINIRRVLLAGLVAGLVMNVVDFVVNGILLAPGWTAAVSALKPGSDAMASGAMIAYVLLDFVFGILIVANYAAMRPRFGAGPKTAVIASVNVWLISVLSASTLVLNGLFPTGLVAQSSLGSLVGWVAGGYLGGRLYSEPAAASAARTV